MEFFHFLIFSLASETKIFVIYYICFSVVYFDGSLNKIYKYFQYLCLLSVSFRFKHSQDAHIFLKDISFYIFTSSRVHTCIGNQLK